MNTHQQWSQSQAISFECANEVLTDLIGICTSAIAFERSKPKPRHNKIDTLEKELSKLSVERAKLSIYDSDTADKIRREYGAKVRLYRSKMKSTRSIYAILSKERVHKRIQTLHGTISRFFSSCSIRPISKHHRLVANLMRRHEKPILDS